MRHLRTYRPFIQIEAFNRRLSGGVQAEVDRSDGAGQALDMHQTEPLSPLAAPVKFN